VRLACVLLALGAGFVPAAVRAQGPVPASPAPSAAATPAARPIAFADLSLGQAESAALATSPDVAQADAVVRENAAAVSAARGALGPSLTSSYVRAPQGGSNNDTITQRLTTVGVQTTVGDVLAYSPALAGAEATLRGARASLLVAQRTERVKVIGLYYDALKARAIAQARDEALRTAQQQRDAAAIRVRAGDAPRLDLVRANVAVARATAAAETARATDQNATEALAVEANAKTALASTVDGPLSAAPDVVPSDAVALALRNRADLRAASEATTAAQAAVTAARRSALPAITVGAGYETGVDTGVQIHGPTLNVTVGIPLNGAAHAQVAQKTAVVAETVAKAQAQQRQIQLDVAAAARTLSATQRATAASTQAREEAYAELQATGVGYRNGASSSLELASARDTYTQAVVDELSSLYDELKARATLDLEVGP
jgi:cobalt-zinc-cadmium efflux system outer membrane protein